MEITKKSMRAIATAGLLSIGAFSFAAEDVYVMIFDFKKKPQKTEERSRDRVWRVVNDTVMGGVSSSKVEISQNETAVFSGTVSLENNGGFCSVRSPLSKIDLSEYEGIAVRIRSDGRQYKFTLRTDGKFDGVVYQAPLEAPEGEWEIVHIPFDDFVPTFRGRQLRLGRKLETDAIQTFGAIIADKQSGPFQLEFDWIGTYRKIEEATDARISKT